MQKYTYNKGKSGINCVNLANKSKAVNMIHSSFTRLTVCGYETWTITLRDEDWLRAFQNGMLRKYFNQNEKRT